MEDFIRTTLYHRSQDSQKGVPAARTTPADPAPTLDSIPLEVWD